MDTTGGTVMCLDQLELYHPNVVKSLSSSPSIPLALSTHSATNYNNWQFGFNKISGLDTIFPIYLFHDSDAFGYRLSKALSFYKNLESRIIKLV